MTEVLPAQLQGIGEGHGANPLTLPQGAADQYANPEWGR
jgi:hypothetical protein